MSFNHIMRNPFRYLTYKSQFFNSKTQNTYKQKRYLSTNKIENIAVIGVGGVGGYYGGKLALAYANSNRCKVNFIARGEHYRKIRTNGLELITTTAKHIVKPSKLVTSINELPKQDLIILATKFYDLPPVIEDLKKYSPNQSFYVMPLLNGVNVKDVLRKIVLTEKIIDSCVYISSHVISPGVVKQSGGSCELLLGSNSVDKESLTEINNIFTLAGIKASIHQNMESVMWRKYLFVCPMSCMLVAYSTDKNAILSDNILLEELKGLMSEISVLASKKGIMLPENIIEQSIDNIKKSAPTTIPSMQWDFDNNNQVEIEIFPEYIVNEAKKLSIKIPYHEAIFERLKSKIEFSSEHSKKCSC